MHKYTHSHTLTHTSCTQVCLQPQGNCSCFKYSRSSLESWGPVVISLHPVPAKGQATSQKDGYGAAGGCWAEQRERERENEMSGGRPSKSHQTTEHLDFAAGHSLCLTDHNIPQPSNHLERASLCRANEINQVYTSGKEINREAHEGMDF
ncbi:hypothetical protein DR999_PMT19351 [Platysternon megacephalum]|uniref:Uncharacterized protein n=1 Tax=Platysternon megacephalum TaxID=55544 RepID=A0A4D9DVP5_9SAUR|nr:hypothetical protein DR999_PMT19351 [Platysternon megacephalum]